MNTKEISELKKRMKKAQATFTQVSWCYVDGEKRKISNSNSGFLSLPEEEYYKYLEIAKKSLSGKVGDALLTLDVKEDSNGQKSLLALRESRLKVPEIRDAFYDAIIKNYDYAGNYLIVLFHDVYDVVERYSDGTKSDEPSEEVFEYIICSICPVDLSKAGLGYRETENKIAARVRDWVVGAPATAFLYPAFNDRTTDLHSILFYTKNTKEPHFELLEEVLEADVKRTATEKKDFLKTAIESVSDNEDNAAITYAKMQENILYKLEEAESLGEKIEENQIDLVDVLEECDISKDEIQKVKERFEQNLSADDSTSVNQIFDKKVAENSADVIHQREMAKENIRLKEALKKAKEELLSLTGKETSLTREIQEILK